MIKYLRLLLLPFSLFYGIVVVLRNKLYDLGLLKSVKFDIPIICVGNLVVGGSGKSPATEYLVRLLDGYKIAILSRGYGRETKGFILADERATALSIGDEPMQFYHKFPKVTVAVCEDRVKGINLLKEEHDLVILDDAYQHRRVQPGFSILLFEFQKLLRPQFLLPAGNLREPFFGCKRAQAVLVTKSPSQISNAERIRIVGKFANSTKYAISFSSLQYGNLKHLFKQEEGACSSLSTETTVYLLTGIANPSPLIAHLKTFTAYVDHHEYPDHYRFSLQNIRRLVDAFHNNPSKEKLIITTEKDAQRLLDDSFKELLLNLPVFYLPIKIALQDEDKVTFDQNILDYVSSTTRNR